MDLLVALDTIPLTDLPEDIIIIITEALCRISKVSVIVFAYVSKYYYKIAKQCAIDFKISRTLQCEDIASEGLLEILKWARSSGYKWDSWTCGMAAENGHLEVLKWAHLNGCEWHPNVCAGAAWGGHLDVLKWLRSNGCRGTWQSQGSSTCPLGTR